MLFITYNSRMDSVVYKNSGHMDGVVCKKFTWELGHMGSIQYCVLLVLVASHHQALN